MFSQVLLEIYIHRLNRNWFVCCVLAPFIQSPPQYQGAAWLNRLIGSLPASASFSASPHVPLPLPTSTTSSQGRRIVPLLPLERVEKIEFHSLQGPAEVHHLICPTHRWDEEDDDDEFCCLLLISVVKPASA